MASSSYDSVLANMPSLSADQRRQLERLFATWTPPPAGAPLEEQLDYRLASRGLLRCVPCIVPETPPRSECAPVRINGSPLSRTIIEERR